MAGSSAPRFQWKRDPTGRIALMVLLCCAYRLGFTDDICCYEGKLPKQEDIEPIFLSVMPWFPAYYDQYRSMRAQRIGFQGKLDLFNMGDLHDRLAYMYENDGIGDEHPKSTEQAKPGKLRETWVKWGTRVMDAVMFSKEITVEQALEWGRPKEKK